MSKTTNRTVTYHDDLGYLVVANKGSHSMHFTVYDVMGTASNTEVYLPLKNSNTSESALLDVETLDFSPFQIYLHGDIKWDGCSNMHFDEQENCMLHFCGRTDALKIGILLGYLYKLAETHIEKADINMLRT